MHATVEHTLLADLTAVSLLRWAGQRVVQPWHSVCVVQQTDWPTAPWVGLCFSTSHPAHIPVITNNRPLHIHHPVTPPYPSSHNLKHVNISKVSQSTSPHAALHMALFNVFYHQWHDLREQTWLFIFNWKMAQHWCTICSHWDFMVQGVGTLRGFVSFSFLLL